LPTPPFWAMTATFNMAALPRMRCVRQALDDSRFGGYRDAYGMLWWRRLRRMMAGPQ
jgi:hypothetical protein